MKISFPQMGNYWIAFKDLFEGMDFDVLLPQKTTRKTMELGSKYSPEFACLPFKITLGNYIESIRLGADTLLQAGRVGACRYGYYGEAQEAILHDIGYDVRIINLFEGETQINFIRALKKLNPKASLAKIINSAFLMFRKIDAIDSLEQKARKIRAREVKKGSVDDILKKSLDDLDKAKFFDIRKIRKKFYRETEKISIDKGKNSLKVGIIGEIYLVIEPFSNLNIEEKLGELDVEVYRPICLSNTIKDTVFPWRQKEIIRKRKEFAKYDLGAEAGYSIGHAVKFAEEGFDGIIHIYPFTCMPEQSAAEILPEISKKLNIPILIFSLDEHAAEAGFSTRLEAFVETLHERRKNKNYE